MRPKRRPTYRRVAIECARSWYRKLTLAAASATNCHAPTGPVIRKNAQVFLMTVEAGTTLRNRVTRLTDHAKSRQEPTWLAAQVRRCRPSALTR